MHLNGLRKRLLPLSCPYTCTSVRMYRRDSHQADLSEILYCGLFWKCVEGFQICWNLAKISGILHEHLSTFYCCLWLYINTKVLSLGEILSGLNLRCSIRKCLFNERKWRSVKHNSSNVYCCLYFASVIVSVGDPAVCSAFFVWIWITRAWRWFSRIKTCGPNITLYV